MGNSPGSYVKVGRCLKTSFVIKGLNQVMFFVTDAPRSPTLMNVPPTSCDPMSGNQVTIQWSPPTDTGGPGVNIDHYVVDVTGPAGVTCSPEPCHMISGTTTTITGLLCNTSYTVTVRAVNCIGEGPSSQPVIITPSSGKATVILNLTSVHTCTCTCTCRQSKLLL